MTRIAVLSDVHISPPGPLASFHAGDKLASLLARLRSDHGVDTLVLAGDVFDFLALPTATATMHPEQVPAFVSQALSDVSQIDWGKQIFDALGALAVAGTQIVVIPGNHDPELAHPDVPAILRARCGLAVDDRRLDVYLGSGPWRTAAGVLEVVIGHGHRGDPWNDIDPAMVLHHATTNPPLPLQLPLGSRLVVGAMRAFRDQYTFVDALKPEMPGVALLLAYLDPTLAMKHLPGVATFGARAWVGGLQRRLQRGPTLPAGPPAARSAPQPPSDIDLLAAALFDALAAAERTPGTIAAVEGWLAGHGASAAGTLASHGGGRFLLRAALRLLGRNGTAFDQARVDDADEAIIAEHLPSGCGARVVIAGHTHAARQIRLDADRTYINTGTWTDLIPWPPLGADDDAKRFIDDLEANNIPVLRRLTWALIDEHGAQLLDETGGRGLP
jgi:UDP-2,3-diacylglucosamine pyrophosphatase LpxH